MTFFNKIFFTEFFFLSNFFLDCGKNLKNVNADQVLQAKETTDTGEMAKQCLNEPAKFAECLEIDKGFVIRLAKILMLLAHASQ